MEVVLKNAQAFEAIGAVAAEITAARDISTDPISVPSLSSAVWHVGSACNRKSTQQSSI